MATKKIIARNKTDNVSISFNKETLKRLDEYRGITNRSRLVELIVSRALDEIYAKTQEVNA